MTNRSSTMTHWTAREHERIANMRKWPWYFKLPFLLAIILVCSLVDYVIGTMIH